MTRANLIDIYGLKVLSRKRPYACSGSTLPPGKAPIVEIIERNGALYGELTLSHRPVGC